MTSTGMSKFLFWLVVGGWGSFWVVGNVVGWLGLVKGSFRRLWALGRIYDIDRMRIYDIDLKRR